MSPQITIQEVLAKCSGPVISRKEAAKVSGGLVSEKFLANLDSSSKGPVERVRVGRRVGYVSNSFAEWLVARVEVHRRGQTHD